MKRVLMVFLLSYFEYHQKKIWLNVLIDDHHLSSITKFERNKFTTQVATTPAKCQVPSAYV
jgi:hypothetical protein